MSMENGQCPIGLSKRVCFCCTFSKEGLCDYPHARRKTNQFAIELHTICKLARASDYTMPQLNTITPNDLTMLRIDIELEARN